MKPQRIDTDRLAAQWSFPDLASAPADKPVCYGGDLSPGRLTSAYAQGLFPWYDENVPILWWSPDPRFVLPLENVRITKSLRKEAEKPGWSVRFDEDFASIITACASTPRKGQDGTWITSEMQTAYLELHQQGLVHCVGAYWQGELVGGLYGVSLGRMFFGESMYHHKSNASKVALYTLVNWLRKHDFTLIDCQQKTPLLASFGAVEISRSDFLQRLQETLQEPTLVGKWV